MDEKVTVRIYKPEDPYGGTYEGIVLRGVPDYELMTILEIAKNSGLNVTVLCDRAVGMLIEDMDKC